MLSFTPHPLSPLAGSCGMSMVLGEGFHVAPSGPRPHGEGGLAFGGNPWCFVCTPTLCFFSARGL